jgi:N-acetylglucosamine kinase-like BadF-type ATPase
MPYILGVDAGSSKTHALLLNRSGQVLGFGRAGPGNHQTSGRQAAFKEIEKAVQGALQQAGGITQPVDLGCFCLAGADLPEDFAMLQTGMEDLHVADKVLIKNDTFAALRAGITRSWGVAVICGTGFNAAARAPDGREYVLPGLGFISGDWGGGWSLSQEMIRLVMRAWDGRGEPTLLTDLVLDALQQPSEEILIENLYFEKINPRQLITLVPLIFQAVLAGDKPASDLIKRLGIEVAVTAKALIRRFDMQDLDVEVVLAGGVFKGEGPLLIDTVRKEIHREAPLAQIRRLNYEPVVGAALLGMEADGVEVNKQVWQQIHESLPNFLRREEADPMMMVDKEQAPDSTGLSDGG